MESSQKCSFWDRLRAFLVRKDIVFSGKRYGIDALGAMAFGLFGSLLIGTIFNAIGLIPGLAFFKEIGAYGAKAAGAAMAVAIAFALKAPPFVMYSVALVGMMANTVGGAGGPLAVLLITIVATELGKAVSKETKVDILVTPVVTITSGVLLAQLICPAVAYVMYFVGNFINTATEFAPFFMGIILSVVVGVVLTLPISSAALCAMLGLSGLAGGAATAGCCAQMVGFAVISFRENRVGGLIAQGLGTSMLQMGNIVKKPQIWIPPTLAAAVVGPIATCLFKLECTGVSAGMGTCGLVGPIGIIADMGFTWNSVLGILFACIVLPAVLSFIFNEIMRKMGWIKTGDMQLEL